MPNPNYRYFVILTVVIISATNLTGCNSSTIDLQTDSVLKLAIHYLNTNKPDSFYQLTDQTYRKQVTPDFWASFYKKKLSTVLPLANLTFIARNDSASQYKVYGKIPLNCYIRLDKQSKIEIFNFTLYQDGTKPAVKGKKALTDNKLISKLDSTVDQAISAYIQTYGNVGVSAGIFYNGRSYYYNYGEHKKGSEILPDQHTIYDIGSTTKTFTATLLAIAVEQEKVKLETPILKFLPDSVAENPDLKEITFKDLANHTSGLPFDPVNLAHTITDVDQPFDDYGIKDMFSFLKHFKQTRHPGAMYGYSNLGSGLLGVLLEKIYQQSYPDLVRQYITAPLQMNETVCTIDTTKFKNLAQGYGKGSEPVPFINMIALQAAGVIKSSAFDLLSYSKAQLFTANPVLRKAVELTHRTTFNDGSNMIGLGWYNLSEDPNLLQHSGSTTGYRSYICVDLSKQIALVILTNNNTPVRIAMIGENLIRAIQAMPAPNPLSPAVPAKANARNGHVCERISFGTGG